MRRLVLVVVLAGALLAGPTAALAGAGDPAPTTSSSSSIVELPPEGIVPEPNSGQAPEEAGDRGGALQLGILAALLLAVGGAVAHLVRTSRRARA